MYLCLYVYVFCCLFAMDTPKILLTGFKMYFTVVKLHSSRVTKAIFHPGTDSRSHGEIGAKRLYIYTIII